MSSEQRQEAENAGAFAQHAEQDPSLGATPTDESIERPGMTFVGRMMVFMVFPMTMGVAGMYIGYLRTIREPEKKIDFDSDFVFPFIMTLALVIVVSFQTKGFTKSTMTPLVQWPKVRRKKKIIHKRVIVDDDGNEITEDAKKND